MMPPTAQSATETCAGWGRDGKGNGSLHMRKEKPNILFIFADQLRHSAVGCYGNSVVQTPNLNRLATEGVVFDQAFSSCPLCSPYRAHILSGMYSHRNGVPDNEYKMRTDIIALPQALSAAGYRSAFVGKWHLGHPPYTDDKRYGFDYMAAYDCCGMSYYKQPYFINQSGPNQITKWLPAEETDLAIQFMEEHRHAAPEKPFAIVMSWGPPHWPYYSCPEEYQVHDPEKVELFPNVPGPLAPHARQESAAYYNNVTGLDAQMGRLMDALERMGIAEDTILCFSSDHGDHLYSHGYGAEYDQWVHISMRGSKGSPFDESVRIPLIVRYPRNGISGERSDVLFNSVDVMPTLLRLCGIEIPNGVQGTDLSHTIIGGQGPEPDSVYLLMLGPGWPTRDKWVGIWRGVRTHRYLYARYQGNYHDTVLFDRKKDPYEMKNLANDPAHAAVHEELEARLKRWMRETNDPFDVGPWDPKNGMLLLGQELTELYGTAKGGKG